MLFCADVDQEACVLLCCSVQMTIKGPVVLFMLRRRRDEEKPVLDGIGVPGAGLALAAKYHANKGMAR